ncbi:hypothetical protein IXO141_03930, partial [Xanthomonas oryzae pv. oryzae]
ALLHVQSPRGRELDSKLRCYSKSGDVEIQHCAPHLIHIHCHRLGALAGLLQNRADLLEPLTAHVTWIVLLAHSWSLHGLNKIVNRF